MLSDYVVLCKPRVVLLMLITAWVGMYMAQPYAIHWPTYVFASIGIGCAASAAAVINHLLDRELDRKMQRTAARPLACGRIQPQNALIFASILAVCAWIILHKYVNLLTAILSFATLFGYALIYTVYLKHATAHNIVIGGLAGAMPPLLGWTAITGEINSFSWLLVLIIFTWTPPHFWALAIYRIDDYRNAQIPMLPVTHGIKITKLCVLLYTILLAAISCLPFAVGLSGYIYLAVAIPINTLFIIFALRLYLSEPPQEHKLAIQTFKFSLHYLLLLFMALVIDRALQGWQL